MNENNINNDSFPVASTLWSQYDWKDLRIGRYELKRHVGTGSMGRVFLANDVILRRKVALKVISESVKQAHETGHLEQFIREAQTAAALSHPNIARIYDIVNEDGIVAIANEFIEGGTLEYFIDRVDKTNKIDACRIVAEACDGLHFAHINGMVHCDVKPANMMLTKSNQCKIVDFGASWIKRKKKLAVLDGKIIGTPYTISPEVIVGDEPTPASDIYSLGIVLWWALVGCPPFYAKTRKELYNMHLDKAPPDLSKYRADIPDALVHITHKCLAKEPEDRYSDCESVAERLYGLVDYFQESKGMLPKPRIKTPLPAENSQKSSIKTKAIKNTVAPVRTKKAVSPPRTKKTTADQTSANPAKRARRHRNTIIAIAGLVGLLLLLISITLIIAL